MADALRLGLIGTGGMMRSHVRNLQSIRDATVVALVDPDPAHIASVKKQFPELAGCNSYSDHHQMLETEGLDAVLIASPHHAHRDQIIDSLRAGCHVLTEKPMVCSIEDARQVIQAEKETARMVGIGYQRHTQPEFRYIKKCLESGNAGEVQFINAFQGQDWLRGCRGTWRQVMELSCGGQLNDSGSHLIDIILYVTGLQARRVMASIENFDVEVDINSALTIDFANGAMGSIAVVGNCPLFWEDITFVCSEWTFFLRQGKLTYSTGGRGEILTLDRAQYGENNPTRNFIDAIQGRQELLAPSVCGLRTIELTEAAWKSAASGEPVTL
jgi:predicted dehydrogenase